MVSSWRVLCIWTSGTDSVVNDVHHVVHDPGALHGHDYVISGGPAIHAGLVLPSVSELGDTEETSLTNGSNDQDHWHPPHVRKITEHRTTVAAPLSLSHAVHHWREGQYVLLVHWLCHGIGDVLVRVNVSWLDDQVAHRLADDSNSDGQVTTAEVDVVCRRVRQRRGVVHEEGHDDITRQSAKTRLIHKQALVHRDVSASHSGDELRTAGGGVDLMSRERPPSKRGVAAPLPVAIVTGHVGLVGHRRVDVRDGGSTVACAAEVERTTMCDGVRSHPLHAEC